MSDYGKLIVLEGTGYIFPDFPNHAKITCVIGNFDVDLDKILHRVARQFLKTAYGFIRAWKYFKNPVQTSEFKHRFALRL